MQNSGWVQLGTWTVLAGEPGDFSLSASPTAQTVPAGSSASYTISVTPIGLASTVTFSASGQPAGAALTFNPPSVAGAGSTTLAVTPPISNPEASYTVTITGSNGTYNRTTTVTLSVTNDPPIITGYTLPWDMSASDVEGGLDAMQINVTTSGSNVGCTVFYDGAFSLDNRIGPGACSLDLSATGSFSGFAASMHAPLIFDPVQFNGTKEVWMAVSDTAGQITQIYAGDINVAGPDFTLSNPSGPSSVQAGTTATYTVTVTPLNEFTGAVTFSGSSSPAGLGFGFSPNPVITSGSTTVSVSSSLTTPPGSYQLTITGRSGAITRSVSTTLQLTAPPDFSLSASPTTRTVPAGATASYTISVTPIGPNSTVTFSASGQPAGGAVSFSPNSVTGAGSSTLSVTPAVSNPQANYTITVTGANGIYNRTTAVTLSVTNDPPLITGYTVPSDMSVSDAEGGLDAMQINITTQNSNEGCTVYYNGSFSVDNRIGAGACWLDPSAYGAFGAFTASIHAPLSFDTSQFSGWKQVWMAIPPATSLRFMPATSGLNRSW